MEVDAGQLLPPAGAEHLLLVADCLEHVRNVQRLDVILLLILLRILALVASAAVVVHVGIASARVNPLFPVGLA